MPVPDGPLLLYDAHCSVCRRFVQWFVHADTGGRLRIAPLKSTWGDAVRREHPGFEAMDSAIWVPEGGTPVHRSGAVLGVMHYLGGFWGDTATVAKIVPRPVRDWIYRTFAANRRFFGWMGLDKFDEPTWRRLLPDSPEPDTKHGAALPT